MSGPKEAFQTKLQNAISEDIIRPAASCRRSVPAVLVRNANFRFGRGRNQVIALDRLGLTVPAGVIYALLGPSGCGKTCLLKCILGRRTLHQGTVEVFGCKPGQDGAGVPGPWVGYMPQDLQLYSQLSVTETLRYFGRLNRLSNRQLEEAVYSVRELLDLTDYSRLVSGLSGGQKRRLSLSVAMLHSPALLVLDEPTVGLDPILRALLWRHLTRLVLQGRTTVLLTTHYVEEARQAHLVGLMRNGRVLVERDPEKLLKELEAKNMEDAFALLCLRDEKGSEGKERSASQGFGHENPAYLVCDGEEMRNIESHETDKGLTGCSSTRETTSLDHNPLKTVTVRLYSSDSEPYEQPILPPKCVRTTVRQHFSIMGTVAVKNLHLLKRNMLFFFAVFLLPLVVLPMVRALLGHDPSDLPLAVVNEEQPPILSRYLLNMMPQETLVLKDILCLEKAEDSVQSGLTIGLLHIKQDFTRSIRRRLVEGVNATESVIRSTQIRLKMGTRNSVLIGATHEAVFKAFKAMTDHFAAALGENPSALQLSLDFEKLPGRGQDVTPFSHTLSAAWTSGIIYIIGLGASCLAFVQEIESGMLDRSQAAGLTLGQMLSSQVLMQLVVSLVHVSSAVGFLWIFGMTAGGSLPLATTILVLQSGLGLAHGILLSWVTGSTLASCVILTGAQGLDYCVSGLSWPMEALPHWAQQTVFYLSPVAASAQSLKMVLFRGMALGHSFVRFTILLNALRIIATFLVLLVVIRIRK